MGWSLVATPNDVLEPGVGLTLGGQGTLIFGLVLVVSRLWRNSRYACGKLQDVHAGSAQLQHTADALTATRSGGAPAFYADLVRGASPQMLLANLKGQLDQLATRVGQCLVTCSSISPRRAARFPRPHPRSSRAIARACRGRGW